MRSQAHNRKYHLPEKKGSRGQHVIARGSRAWNENVEREKHRHRITTSPIIDLNKDATIRTLLLLNLLFSYYFVPAETTSKRNLLSDGNQPALFSFPPFPGSQTDLEMMNEKHPSEIKRDIHFKRVIKGKIKTKPGQEKACAVIPEILHSAIELFPNQEAEIMKKALTDPTSLIKKLDCIKLIDQKRPIFYLNGDTIYMSALQKNEESFTVIRRELIRVMWYYLHKKEMPCGINNNPHFSILSHIPVHPVDAPHITAYAAALVSDTNKLSLNFDLLKKAPKDERKLLQATACGDSLIARKKPSVSTLFRSSLHDNDTLNNQMHLETAIINTIGNTLREFALITSGTLYDVTWSMTNAIGLSYAPRYSHLQLITLAAIDATIALLPEECQQAYFPDSFDMRKKTIDFCGATRSPSMNRRTHDEL